MKETIALHGTKELLQQARKDLVADGFKDNKEWNEYITDKDRLTVVNHLIIYNYNPISLMNHEGHKTNTIIDLTPENYEHVINLIKTKKDELQV